MEKGTEMAAKADMPFAAKGEARRKLLYDAACKRLLSNRLILAHILKGTVAAYGECPLEMIANEYIEPSESASTGSKNEVDATPPPMIRGMRTEDADPHDGSVFYDVLFRASLPDVKEGIECIVNVEAQTVARPGYPLMERAQYYCARLLSSQRGTEFTHSHYEQLKKVYSIWVCTNPPRRFSGRIIRYQMAPTTDTFWGRSLMGAAIVCVSSPGTAGLPGLLGTLFSDIDPLEKAALLESEYNVGMTSSMEDGVMAMCNLGQAIEDRGIARGILKSRVESIRNLMKNMGLSIDRAMEVLGIPSPDRAACIEKLQEEELGPAVAPSR